MVRLIELVLVEFIYGAMINFAGTWDLIPKERRVFSKTCFSLMVWMIIMEY